MKANAAAIADENLYQTAEDIDINRAISKRIGTWKWSDSYAPSGQYRLRERALGMTGSRVGFSSAARVLCKGE